MTGIGGGIIVILTGTNDDLSDSISFVVIARKVPMARTIGSKLVIVGKRVVGGMEEVLYIVEEYREVFVGRCTTAA